jgi:hypothetical protein
MIGCVTLGSRNIAFAMNTDDVVIWFTVGEDLGSPSLSPVRGDYITPTGERVTAPKVTPTYHPKVIGHTGMRHRRVVVTQPITYGDRLG